LTERSQTHVFSYHSLLCFPFLAHSRARLGLVVNNRTTIEATTCPSITTVDYKATEQNIYVRLTRYFPLALVLQEDLQDLQPWFTCAPDPGRWSFAGGGL